MVYDDGHMKVRQSNPSREGGLPVWFDVVAVCKQAGMESAFMLLHIATFKSKPKFVVGLSMGPISFFKERWKRWEWQVGHPAMLVSRRILGLQTWRKSNHYSSAKNAAAVQDR